MSIYYSRDGTPIGDLPAWAKGFERRDRSVKKTILRQSRLVSTVFLGLDHSFGSGPPLIFETMIFPCDADGNVTEWGELLCDRYSTEDEALAGHQRICEAWAEADVVEQP